MGEDAEEECSADGGEERGIQKGELEVVDGCYLKRCEEDEGRAEELWQVDEEMLVAWV